MPLNTKDQDSLNSRAQEVILWIKCPENSLKIIREVGKGNKSKVLNSRSKPVVAKVSTSTSTSGISPDVSELKDMVKALLLDKKNQSQAPAHQTPCIRKSVEESCGLAGGGSFISKLSRHRWQWAGFNQPPAYQAPVYQAPFPQTQGVSKTDFDSYVKANDAVMRNVQKPGSKPASSINNFGYFESKGLKQKSRPAIPSTSSSSPKVMNRDIEVTKDTMIPTNNGSTEDVQPSVVQVESQNPTSEPVVDPVSAPRPNHQPSIQFPSRRNDERRREKAKDQLEILTKSLEI
ncbi:hypothetical protein Tco_0470924 [Tanacetum coccineum]